MTLSLIMNIVFAALVLIAIPGLLAWAIRTSNNENPPRRRALRRPIPHPSYSGPRFSSGYGRPEGGRSPVQDAG
jgi:uncharacterized iron-regulated membrane protein